MTGREVYAFGDCVLEVSERRLSKGGAAVALAPKAFELLVALVRQAGQLVTKGDLLDRVWPDSHVEEGILSVHVSALRRALEDRGARGRVIETVAGSGYRFVAAAVRREDRRDSSLLRWPVGTLPSEPAVHELIGQGRALLLTASRPEIPKAIAAFRSAIELDPTYAAAHAGLARACCAQAEMRLAALADAYGDARAAALRALAMDPACADAQVALGTVMFLCDWNWAGAERSLARALELDPDHTEAYLTYGRLLEARGEFDRALVAKKKALERDPFSGLVHLQIALSYWHQRRYDDVIAWAQRALSIDPRHLLAREFMAGAYLKKGDFDRQLEESILHAESFGCPPEMIAEFRRVYAEGGRRGLARHAIELAATQPSSPVQMAILHGELGNLDDAFDHLDRAIDSRDPSVVHLAVAPQWDDLRDDSRFSSRLARLGLDDVGARRVIY